MAKNETGKKNKRNDDERKNSGGLKTHTKHGIAAIIFFVFTKNTII
jgi:hypothetical protein